ncbi:MAG: 50S ribosomal protein L3 [Verrucomicrobiota bacterium]
MSIGLLGKKIGMTRVYNDDGEMIPVTVIEVGGNTVLQVKKTDGPDGYSAVQVGFDDQKEQRVNKPELGHFQSSGSGAKRVVKEFRFDSDEELPADDLELGPDMFEKGQMIDVIGTSKGKGFQGAMRRHNFQGQKMTHGSMMHRRTGAVGAGSTPARIWKNTKMPGRQGGERITVQNLTIVESRADDNVLLVSGAVPGAKGGYVIIRPAVKAGAKKD